MFDQRPGRPGPTTGLTLVDLLVALAVAAILLTQVVPAFSGLLQDNRMTGTINDLVGDLNAARSAAIRYGEQAVVCKSADRASCTKAGRWDQDWLVVVDSDRDREVDGTEPILRTGRPPSDGPTVSYSAFPTDNYVVYYPSGLIRGNGTFTFCDKRGAGKAKAVILAKAGRLQVSTAASDGSALTCP